MLSKIGFNIKSRIIIGEEKLVCKVNLMENYDEFKEKIEQYKQKDIFNCDETALFYKCLTKKTLAMSDEKKTLAKSSKERATLMLCCSLEGEKIKPLIIGKSKKPRWIKNSKNVLQNIDYKNSKKAWMTRYVFEEWLSDLNSFAF